MKDNMNGEILSIDTTQKLARLERDKNLFKIQLDAEKIKNDKLMQEVEYLRKRDKTFTALENSIPIWIDDFEKKNAPKIVIREIEYLGNMLAEEKEKLLKNRGVEDEEI